MYIHIMELAVRLYNPRDEEVIVNTSWRQIYNKINIPNGVYIYHAHKSTCVARMIIQDAIYLLEQGMVKPKTTTGNWNWGLNDDNTHLPDEELRWILYTALIRMLKLAIQYPDTIWIYDKVFTPEDFTDVNGFTFKPISFSDPIYGNDGDDKVTYKMYEKIPEYEEWESSAYFSKNIVFSHRPRVYDCLMKPFFNGQVDPHYITITSSNNAEKMIYYYENEDKIHNKTIWIEILRIFQELEEQRGKYSLSWEHEENRTFFV